MGGRQRIWQPSSVTIQMSSGGINCCTHTYNKLVFWLAQNQHPQRWRKTKCLVFNCCERISKTHLSFGRPRPTSPTLLSCYICSRNLRTTWTLVAPPTNIVNNTYTRVVAGFQMSDAAYNTMACCVARPSSQNNAYTPSPTFQQYIENCCGPPTTTINNRCK